jgi:alkanesulfonate monooxygenase SsuD/methylene tetrahydromethanopterin reductase-like flavin-dependent oxidoreductase (luciferase family)
MTASTTPAPAGRERYGIALPQRPGGGPGELGRLCALAESLGFASGWVADHLRGPDPALDPFTTLAFDAAHTSTLRLGVAIAVSAARPWPTASVSSARRPGAPSTWPPCTTRERGW